MKNSKQLLRRYKADVSTRPLTQDDGLCINGVICAREGVPFSWMLGSMAYPIDLAHHESDPSEVQSQALSAEKPGTFIPPIARRP
eukprot:158985-Rhodomonas_salina.2